jgi:hypothetical protein
MTRAQIRARVIAYFAWRLGAHSSDFDDSTRVRRRFSPGAWRGLADTFNNANWMIDLDVRLKRSEMDDLSTVGGITDLINTKANG